MIDSPPHVIGARLTPLLRIYNTASMVPFGNSVRKYILRVNIDYLSHVSESFWVYYRLLSTRIVCSYSMQKCQSRATACSDLSASENICTSIMKYFTSFEVWVHWITLKYVYFYIILYIYTFYLFTTASNWILYQNWYCKKIVAL